MTEDEAKTKRCCGPEGCGGYGDHNDPLMELGPERDASGLLLARIVPGQARNCIGAACMAWHWVDSPAIGQKLLESTGGGYVQKDDGSYDKQKMFSHEEYHYGPARGYCGLAGKP